MAFQSTLPVWGATGQAYLIPFFNGNFNPRSPCGERLLPVCPVGQACYFNPRSPCGERPATVCGDPAPAIPISIHAPRVGSDQNTPAAGCRNFGISIHAPRVGSD